MDNFDEVKRHVEEIVTRIKADLAYLDLLFSAAREFVLAQDLLESERPDFSPATLDEVKVAYAKLQKTVLIKEP